MKYKIGDRVRITRDKSKSYHWDFAGKMDKWLGKVMTIKCIERRYYRMEEDCNECCNGGWLWYEEMIDGLADERKIVITMDGKTTKASLYNGKKLEKIATAKCSPEDEFNFKIGAELAVERLFDKNEGKYFTGKAVYSGIGFDGGFTKGRIYDFENGFCLDDDCDKRPMTPEGFLVSELEENGFIAIKE